jgi:RND family efflux transporter MFP subunit
MSLDTAVTETPHDAAVVAGASPPAVPRRRLRFAALVFVALAAIIVITGLATRRMADARLSEWTEEQAVPTVAIAALDQRGRRTTLDLPGRLEAYTQAQLYARVSGYLKEWKADIGTPVKAGELLAEIEAPDLDQQIMQAEAGVTSAHANASLADQTLKRGKSLIPSGAVSQQDLDKRSADSANMQGLVKSAQANLDRLRVLEKYKKIVAPFDGLVTARTTDVGQLINAGASGPPLFVVSDTAKLRVYVNVPQNFVPNIKVGTKAKIAVPEYPGRTFTATVEASAQSVDVGSGTTRMLLVVDNTAGALMTGAFANVQLELPDSQNAIHVPASALMFDKSGLRVATVGADDKVMLKTVTIARDLGREVEIATGLTPEDRVIESPPDGISAGDQVRIATRAGAGNAAENVKPPQKKL